LRAYLRDCNLSERRNTPKSRKLKRFTGAPSQLCQRLD
jgi:hypothetical protein